MALLYSCAKFHFVTVLSEDKPRKFNVSWIMLQVLLINCHFGTFDFKVSHATHINTADTTYVHPVLKKRCVLWDVSQVGLVTPVRTNVTLTVCVTKSQDPVQTVLQVGMDQGASLSAVLIV